MAGSRIKGITVEIGGDTTKLQTAFGQGCLRKNPECRRRLSNPSVWIPEQRKQLPDS